MTVYLSSSYDISDQAKAGEYIHQLFHLLEDYKAKILSFDSQASIIEGQRSDACAIVAFDSEDEANRFCKALDSPDMRELQQSCTTNVRIVISQAFQSRKPPVDHE